MKKYLDKNKKQYIKNGFAVYKKINKELIKEINSDLKNFLSLT